MAILGSCFMHFDKIDILVFFAWLCMGLVREREIVAIGTIRWDDKVKIEGDEESAKGNASKLAIH